MLSHPAPVKSRDESKPLESQLVQHEAEPTDQESPAESEPPAIVMELDKQEVELLVSLVPLQTLAQILICSCKDIFHRNISYLLNIVFFFYYTRACLDPISHQNEKKKYILNKENVYVCVYLHRACFLMCEWVVVA